MKPHTSPPITQSDWINKIIIRQVKSSDLKKLEWDGAYIQYRKVYQRTFQRTREGKSIMWLVELPRIEIIGQVFLQLESSKPEIAVEGQRAYLHGFRIKPAYRYQGLGKKLMAFVEQDLRYRGYDEITLNVAKTNQPAIHLYQSLGYEIIGHESGDWTFRDHHNRLRRVVEPAWKMLKKLNSP